MRIRVRVCVLFATLAVAGPASGQTFESVGVRAQGMGGAFVAVADDATASWWNPAGLATGAYLSGVFERAQTTEPAEPADGGPGARQTANSLAVAFPALGLSYYRVRMSEITPVNSTGGVSADRQDPRIAGTGVFGRSVTQFGVTVGQSIGQHLVVGSTLKLVRAGQLTEVRDGMVPIGDVHPVDVDFGTKADLDLGAMANFGHVRLGATVRNMFQPGFGEEADRFTLRRKARVGLAVLSVPNSLMKGLTVSADADLTTTPTLFGDIRHVAAGAEAWVKGRLGLRAGVSANTIGERRPAGSVGVSLAVTRAFSVNGSQTVGRDESVRGWSTSVSVAF